MTYEQAKAMLERYLEGGLSGQEAAECRAAVAPYEDLAAELALWEQMNEIAVEEPGPGLRLRLAEMLETFRDEERMQIEDPRRQSWFEKVLTSLWPSQPAYGFAAAMLCLAIGLAGGWWIGARGSGDETLRAIRNEVRDTRELAILTMLQQQSAEERLRAVSYSTGIRQPDDVLLGALIRTLRYDTSVDVRLAALDALAAHRDQVAVRRAFVDAVADDSSPLVQVQLIDELAKTGDPQAMQAIQLLAASPTANPTVRLAAAQSLRADL